MINIADKGSDFEFFKKKIVRHEFNCFAVLEDQKTGEKKYIPGRNMVTTVGNTWYATRGAAEASTFQVTHMRLGIGSVAVSAGDLDVTTSFTSCGKSIDSGYPMTSDTDADNTGKGSNVVSWRVTYNTTDVSEVGIRELVLGNSYGAPSYILNHALFAAAFDKTSNDTLKVFVNHSMTGV